MQHDFNVTLVEELGDQLHLIEQGFVNRSSKATKNIIEKINKRNENKCGNVQEHALPAVRQDAGDTSAVP